MANNRVLSGLLSDGWEDLPFHPFKPGISIHWLQEGEPAIALLKYQPGARAPLHFHPAAESVLILSGSQQDENGRYEAGDFVVNFKGTRHEVLSTDGCVALLHWGKAVEFIG